MTDGDRNSLFVFPRWANYALPVIALAAFGGMMYVPTLITLGASPRTTAVGYSPKQPIPYSHKLHVGQLGLDCRYCHFTVEKTAFAAIPPTQVCMNCHTRIRPNSQLLAPLRESWETGDPVQWVKIHDLPDYAYFNHSAHVNHGVGCVSCHGRIDEMEQVYQVCAAEHGVVPRLPSQSRGKPASARSGYESRVEACRGHRSRAARKRSQGVVQNP